MRAFLRTFLSVTISLLIATPAAAYVFDAGEGPERITRRTLDMQTNAQNDVSVRLARGRNMRKSAMKSETGRRALRRAAGRMQRNANRRPKEDSDRYRTLRPNTRSLRQAAEMESMLPTHLLQTGGLYDRPTRRDIWQWRQ